MVRWGILSAPPPDSVAKTGKTRVKKFKKDKDEERKTDHESNHEQ